MLLESSAFAAGASVPRRFTCEGEDLSPPLTWSQAPEGTRSFVVLCEDPDAPAGTWHHWCVYDIPSGWNELGVGVQPGAKGLKQAINDSGKAGYSGPCPPRGHGRHRYQFRLLALSVDMLPRLKRPSCQAVQREALRHVIAEATLVGAYERT